jgi:hypothetical protein
MSDIHEVTPNESNLVSTPILDFQNENVESLKNDLYGPDMSDRDFLKAAHGRFRDDTMPGVYSVDEDQPVSKTLSLGKGSCAQRMACVEALARAAGIPTRVRVLWLDRGFWNSRLPLLRLVLPKRTLMPWPQFFLDAEWVDFEEIYGPVIDVAARSTDNHPFTNSGESVYSSISHIPVDLLGKLKGTDYAFYDISHFVVGDDGFMDTRDDLLKKYDESTWLGKFIFNLLYGGQPIRRIRE